MFKKWIWYLTIILLMAGLAGCETEERGQETGAEQEAEVEREHRPGVVEVEVTEFRFEAPESIPSGWTTFRMENTGKQEHFMVLWPLPEGISYTDFEEDLLGPFMQLSSQYDQGEIDRDEFMEGIGTALPAWSMEFLQGAGGAAMTSPGLTATTTVHLPPGEYVMECYVRSPEGVMHNMLGMLRPLMVTGEKTGAGEPEADRVVDVHADGIDIDAPLNAGSHTIRVNFHEHPEGLLTHDINLARLDDDSDIDEIVAWMDWVDGMRAPAPVEFLGGVEHMPSGSTGYMTVELEPGRYLWVSEGYGARGVLKEFDIE